MVKAGGVELVELQIGHPTPRAPGDRDTVATRAVWVRGVAIGFAGPPGREYDGTGTDCLHDVVTSPQQIGATDPRACLDHIDETAIGEHGDVRGLCRPGSQHF